MKVIVLTKDAIEHMLSILTDQNMDAIQIKEFTDGKLSLIGKVLESSTDGYTFKHDFECNNEVNANGVYLLIDKALKS